jgi:Ribbon-helix-helix domain
MRGQVHIRYVCPYFKADIMADLVRWTLSASKETDVTLRTFLARSGLKKGDLSKFVEDAVQWRLMKLNIAEARARNALLRPEEIEAAVHQALSEVRAARFARSA